jgi:hypothetical protein
VSREIVMRIGMRVIKWTFALTSAVIGFFLGLFGNPAMGGGCGFFFGWFFVPFLLSLKNEYVLAVVFARVLAGTTYGAVAGLISGALVYLPDFLLEKSSLVGGPQEAMGTGALIGLVIGTPFGFLLALITAIAAAVMEKGQATVQAGDAAGADRLP